MAVRVTIELGEVRVLAEDTGPHPSLVNTTDQAIKAFNVAVEKDRPSAPNKTNSTDLMDYDVVGGYGWTYDGSSLTIKADKLGPLQTVISKIANPSAGVVVTVRSESGYSQFVYDGNGWLDITPEPRLKEAKPVVDSPVL